MKKREMAHITSVKVLDGYRLQLRFRDSARRVVDLEPILWGPMFAPMLKLSEFRKVRVNPDFGCIEWPNGADLSPDALRHRRPSKRKNELPKTESDRLGKLIARYNSAPEEKKGAILAKITGILKSAKLRDKESAAGWRKRGRRA